VRSIFSALTVAVATVTAAAAQSAGSGTLIVANMSDNTATVIDLDRQEVLATLPTGPAPHEIAVTGDGRYAVITNYGDRSNKGKSLTIIDLEEVAVLHTIDLGLYERPHGVAVLPGDSLVAVTSEVNQAVVLVQIHTGEIVGSIPTNARASHMLTMDAAGKRIYTTNIVDGSITEIDVVNREALQTIEIAPYVEGIAINPDGALIWIGSNQDKTVTVYDPEIGKIVATLEGFGFPYRMAVTPDSRTAVLSDPASGEVRIVDVATREERHRVVIPKDGVLASAEIPDSPAPEGIALSRDNRVAYVSLQGKNQAVAIDLETGVIVAVFDTGGWPDGIGFSPLTR
jgi:DNA-binding beta-propeller fold protein YncE